MTPETPGEAMTDTRDRRRKDRISGNDTRQRYQMAMTDTSEGKESSGNDTRDGHQMAMTDTSEGKEIHQ